MPEDIERAIGRIEGKLDSLKESVDQEHSDTRENFGKVFTAINELETRGCAVGSANRRDIVDLKKGFGRGGVGPKALAAIAAAAAGAMMGIIKGLEWIFSGAK